MSESPSLLLVHAHPDDESIFTGATMARYAAQGARVTLVTCTMGERGGNFLAESPRAGRDGLAAVRAAELKAACAALGVTDQRFLGGPGRWRDSGARAEPRPDEPAGFRAAAVAEAAADLAAVIGEVKPQVIVTYDASGFYGHPDHVQAHRVAWHAYQGACDPARTKFYALTIPRSVFTAAVSHTPWTAGRPVPPAALELGVPDDQVTTEIDATAYLAAKLAALKAHATQVVVDDPFFKGYGLIGMRALGTEYYVLQAGPGADAISAGHRESDLFAGI